MVDISSHLTAASSLKKRGNDDFCAASHAAALTSYEKALRELAFDPLDMQLKFTTAQREDISALRKTLLLNAAACHVHFRRMQAAVRLCDEALRLVPGDAKALARRGSAWLKEKRLDKAHADFARAVEADPSNKEAARGLRRLKDARAAQRRRQQGTFGGKLNKAPEHADVLSLVRRRTRDLQRQCSARTGLPPPLALGAIVGAPVLCLGLLMTSMLLSAVWAMLTIMVVASASWWSQRREAAARAPRIDATPTGRVWMDVEIGGELAGRIKFGLYGHVVPKTTANFQLLCRGALTKEGKRLCYAGNAFHRVIPGFVAQAGNLGGDGGHSIYGPRFADENFRLKHDRRGLLSMANNGPDSNGSQFFITLGPAAHLDGKHVVFGYVEQGSEVVDAIAAAGTRKGDTTKDVVIVGCGEV